MNTTRQSDSSGALPQQPKQATLITPTDCSRGLVVVLNFALAALVFAAFQPAMDNDFVGYDDPDYITSNFMVQRGLNWEGIKWAFTSTEAANWHPLTWLSHMLDVQLFGLNPAGHHLTSVLLHILSCFLVFLGLRTMTGALWCSLIVAALFGLHPLRAESVAWVAERKDTLSTVFWFLTILVYAHYVRSIASSSSRRRIFYGLALLCFALGLMAKPMLVTLPFVLLLLDFWPLKRYDQKRFSALVVEKAPFLALALASCVITFFVQRNAGAVNEVMSLGYRLSNTVVSFSRYLGKMFWPVDLAFFYPHPPQWSIALVAGAGLLLMVVSVLAFQLRQRQPGLLVGWCWFLGTLVPVIGLVQVGQQSIADRYTYIPSVGVLIALVWGISALLTRHKQLAQSLAIAGGIAALVCLVLTRQQTCVWKSTESLCRHAIAAVPNNYLAHDMLGAVLEKRGDHAAAMREHLRALEINPNYADAHNNLGVGLQHQGKIAEAVEHYQRALYLRPRYAEAHYNLAVALESAGQFDNAATEYSRAIAKRRNYADAHYNLGLLYGRLGRLDLAVVEFRATVAINPRLADVHNNLGVTLDRLGQSELALQHYQQAIALRPDHARTYFNLGVALGKTGRLSAAVGAFETALRLKPDYAEAQVNLDATRAALNSAPAPKF